MYTLQGETWSTRHMLSMLDSRRVPDHTSHMIHVGNLSLVPMTTIHALTPGGSLGDQRQTGPTVTLGHLILPLSQQPWSMGREVLAKWLHSYTSLLGPYTSMWSIRSILAHGGHRSLTDIGGGYNLPNWWSSAFHLRVPPDLMLSNINISL
jgi:hypothetical protein